MTARQREEEAQDVPYALTVLDRDATSKHGAWMTRSASSGRRLDCHLTSFDDDDASPTSSSAALGHCRKRSAPTTVPSSPMSMGCPNRSSPRSSHIWTLSGSKCCAVRKARSSGATARAAPSTSRRARLRSSFAKAACGLEGGEQSVRPRRNVRLRPARRRQRARGRLSFRASTVDGFVDNIAPIGGDLGDQEASYSGRGVHRY